MAISHLGSGKAIGDLDDERSQEAAACRLFYDTSINSTLRDYDWNFARRIVQLTLVQDFRPKQYPNLWNFSYREPAGIAAIRAIQPHTRIDLLVTQIPWEKMADDTGNLIMTDSSGAYARVTKIITAIEQYPSDFVLAASLNLSYRIAPRLTNGDPLGLGKTSYQKYLLDLTQAQKNNEVESRQDISPEGEFTDARY